MLILAYMSFYKPDKNVVMKKAEFNLQMQQNSD